MAEQIVFADNIKRLAECERDRKFLLIGRTDNDFGYTRFEDVDANSRTGQSGHKGIAAAFLEEIAQSGENIPIKYRGIDVIKVEKLINIDTLLKFLKEENSCRE